MFHTGAAGGIGAAQKLDLIKQSFSSTLFEDQEFEAVRAKEISKAFSRIR